MDLKQLREETHKLIHDNPDLKSEILDFYDLAVSEVEEGGSEMHECELAHNDMLELINNL